MDEDMYRTYAREAGRALHRVFARVVPRVRPGEAYADVIREAEARIRDEQVGEAFPPQLSVNEVAAHDTARPEEDRILPEEGVFKLDIGVHVHGVIADAARSIAFGKEAERLVRAVRKAYEAGRNVLEKDALVGVIGKAVEDALHEENIKPVRNLSGHGLGVYEIHTDPQIPNVASESTIKPARHTAFEPFASRGSGLVREEGEAEVFQTAWPVRSRDPIVRKALPFFEKLRGLPFSRRSLISVLGRARAQYVLTRLHREGSLHAYPPLVDTAKGWVAQWEDTFLRTEKGWECTTCREE